MTERDRLKWIYSCKDNQELCERYNQWAQDYDAELMQDYGWQAPVLVTEFLSKYVSRDARILDAGAGTGLVGQCLYHQGYRDLVAIDLSENMLARARDKKVYRKLHQMVLGEPLDFPDAAFDAVVCVGVFTYGHAPASCLDELARITRDGGYIIFIQRSDANESLGFREKQEQLEATGIWRLVEASDPICAFSRKEDEVPHQIWVYQVLED
ncbi:MAG: class I SAM-dependent methyltransferase [Deltaproteobacteria bacterium]|nr:class I SAM-dependent methyltransferase [Deltaproteobacteria bacterium]MBW2071478.1 class I SAM-dependent methyltransferase [Deltaproteobacteria bacterium]